MPLVDSNVWVALSLSKHEFHAAARAWLAQRAPREAHFCRAVQQSFLRLLTTRAMFMPYRIPPLTNKAAWSVYEGLHATSASRGWMSRAVSNPIGKSWRGI